MQMGDENCTKFWSENQKRRDDLEGLGVDGKMVLKYMLKKGWCGRILDTSGSEQGPVALSFEHGNKR
jgi:hypothetical protein